MADKAADDAVNKGVSDAAAAAEKKSEHLIDRVWDQLNDDPTFNGMDADIAQVQVAIEIEIRPAVESVFETVGTTVSGWFK